MKTKLMFNTAAGLGAAAILWMATGFVGANPLALLVTAVIGFVYALGLAELAAYRRATASLSSAVGRLEPGGDRDLQRWLAGLHPSLRNGVMQRIEGEKLGLPVPVFAPYLVGLLVMLGLLGTFIGMVETLQGAVTALQGNTELAAIRDGLSAPIQGLGLAFGTSVAGIAASAMLGLNATLSRRERVLATRALDQLIAGPLREHSLHYNRQQSFKAMQQQADVLPAVAEQLAAIAGELQHMGQGLAEQLVANQQRFQHSSESQFRELAASIDASMRESLNNSGRLAGESIAPLLEKTAGEMAGQAERTHRQLLDLTEQLLHSRAASENDWLAQQGQRMETLTAALREDLRGISGELGEQLGGLHRHQAERDGKIAQRLDSLHTRSAALLADLQRDTAATLAQLEQAAAERLDRLHGDSGERMAALQRTTAGNLAQLAQSTADSLGSLHSDSAERIDRIQAETAAGLNALRNSAEQQFEQLQAAAGDGINRLQEIAGDSLAQLQLALGDGLAGLQGAAAEHLASLGRELQAPMEELISLASETPRAAAEVIGKLREEVSNSIERDNQMLEERQRTLADLAALSDKLQAAAGAQQSAIESMVSRAAGTLEELSARFGERLHGEADKLAEITAHAAESSADMASLGESFSLAVQLFSDSNAQLVDNLGRIEESMEKSTERSDEQMSYYVAQAREIIDQSMLSQREIIEELRRLGQTGEMFAAEAS